MRHMQDDEQVFAFIDAAIRRQCAQKAIQEQPWAGTSLASIYILALDSRSSEEVLLFARQASSRLMY